MPGLSIIRRIPLSGTWDRAPENQIKLDKPGELFLYIFQYSRRDRKDFVSGTYQERRGQ
jgi:hypothetical protein